MTTRDPIVVYCGSCHHEWAVGFFPITAADFAKVGKQDCPKCGNKSVFMGPFPTPTEDGDALAWIGNGDTGISSETIWYWMMRRQKRRNADVPRDPADFGRCYRLLKVMPLWRHRLPDMAEALPAWSPLVGAWDELTALYEEEIKNPSGMAPKLYARMQQLRGVSR